MLSSNPFDLKQLLISLLHWFPRMFLEIENNLSNFPSVQLHLRLSPPCAAISTDATLCAAIIADLCRTISWPCIAFSTLWPGQVVAGFTIYYLFEFRIILFACVYYSLVLECGILFKELMWEGLMRLLIMCSSKNELLGDFQVHLLISCSSSEL